MTSNYMDVYANLKPRAFMINQKQDEFGYPIILLQIQHLALPTNKFSTTMVERSLSMREVPGSNHSRSHIRHIFFSAIYELVY